MSKLTKLLTQPRMYVADAGAKRQRGEPPPQIARAGRCFEQGETLAAEALLDEVTAASSDKSLLRARLALYASRFEQAEQHAFEALLQLHPQTSAYRDAFYLHQEALRYQQRFAQARDMLLGMPFRDDSARFLRAVRLAIPDIEQLGFFERHCLQFPPGHRAWLRARNHHILLLRDLGETERALGEAELLLEQVKRARPRRKSLTGRLIERLALPAPSNTQAQQQRWQHKAGRALSDLKVDLTARGIEFFLISGTLLGCIREGRILGHDSDIDVGVDEAVTLDQLNSAIHVSPRFRLKETECAWTLYVQHASGVNIDIFRHYREGGYYWHEGIKCRWWNTPFTTRETEFLDDHYRIPDNSEAYLAENYGNWQTPRVDFETFLETPNLKVTQSAAMKLYLMGRLIEAWRNQQEQQRLTFEQALASL